MTKSELKTGMVVTIVNGSQYVVYRNIACHYKDMAGKGVTDVLVGRLSWMSLDSFNEDLTCPTNKSSNIVEVAEIMHPIDLIDFNQHLDKTHTIWRLEENKHRQHKEKKQYTYAQLREILGEEFEVVG